MKEIRFFQSPTSKQVMLEMSVPYKEQLEEGLILLQPNSTQASAGSHMPAVQYRGASLQVCVGKEPHPMTQEHHIQWIYVHAAQGGQFRMLHPTTPAEAEFALYGGEVYGVYAYCNLHGLWRLDCAGLAELGDAVKQQTLQVPPARGVH